jgi:hypothetical protein
MNNSTRKTAILALSSALTIFALATTIFGSAYAASATTYSFNLRGPNTALAQNNIPGTPITAGDVLRLTGSGTFDTSKGTASGGGSFTHYKPDGSVFAKGTWVVTGFQSFTGYSSPNRHRQGGVLLVTVTLTSPEATFSGLTMEVSSDIHAPQGASEEGTTLPGLFSVPTGGNPIFHAHHSVDPDRD